MQGVETRFASISQKIKIADLQAELTIIMSDDYTFSVWKEALEKYEEGLLINPDTGHVFKTGHEEKLHRDVERISKSQDPDKEQLETFYVAKPLNRETFKYMVGLTKYDFLTAARRIVTVREDGLPKVSFRKPTKVDTVMVLSSWCMQRKWKNILIRELASRAPHIHFWNNDVIDRKVWTSFKRERGVNKAKWTTLFDAATHDWLKKKQMSNHRNLKANDKLDRMLHEWLSNNFEENVGQVISYHGQIKPDGSLMLSKQRPEDRRALKDLLVGAGFIDFRFFPGTESGGKVSEKAVNNFVKEITDSEWYPGLESIPAWMIISDRLNSSIAEGFMSSLCEKYPDVFYIVPSFYMPCSAEHQPGDPELEKWRTSKIIYVWFFIHKGKMPKRKVFLNPLTAPDASRYSVDPRQWSELKYELFRGELRMETYLTFLAELTATNSLVINFFGGLKPCAASLVIFLSLQMLFVSLDREKHTLLLMLLPYYLVYAYCYVLH